MEEGEAKVEAEVELFASFFAAAFAVVAAAMPALAFCDSGAAAPRALPGGTSDD